MGGPSDTISRARAVVLRDREVRVADYPCDEALSFTGEQRGYVRHVEEGPE
jgi:hypothetical protein